MEHGSALDSSEGGPAHRSTSDSSNTSGGEDALQGSSTSLFNGSPIPVCDGIQICGPTQNGASGSVEYDHDSHHPPRPPDMEVGQVRKAVLFENLATSTRLVVTASPSVDETPPAILGALANDQEHLSAPVSAQSSPRRSDDAVRALSRIRGASTYGTLDLNRAPRGSTLHGTSTQLHRGSIAATNDVLPARQGEHGRNSTSIIDPIQPCGSAIGMDVNAVTDSLKLLWSTVSQENEAEVEFTSVQGSSDSSSLLYFVDGKPFMVRFPRKRCHLPLASISPPHFDYSRLATLFAEVQPSENLKFVLELLTTPTLADFIRAHPAFKAVRQETQRRKQVSREDEIATALDTLVAQNTLADVDPLVASTDAFALPCFLVPKHDLQFSRLIIDCRCVNTLLKDLAMPKMPLPALDDILAAAFMHRFILVRDAASMFYQFPLHSTTSELLTVRVARKRGAFRTLSVGVLPMGLSIAPSAAQHLSNYVAEVTMHRVDAGKKLHIFPWVDNFIILGDSVEIVTHAEHELVKLCQFLGLALKPSDDDLPQTCTTVLGLTLDLEKSEVRPTFETVAAIRKALSNFHSQQTGYAFLKWFGYVSWINYAVALLPMAIFRPVMDAARAIIRAQNFEGAVSVNCTASATALTSRLCEAKRCPVVNNSTTHTLWTDACTHGIGMVLGEEAINFQLDISQRHICAAELLAGLAGATLFARKLSCPYVWAVDNSAACRALARGHSGSRAADLVILRWIQTAPLPVAMSLVPTECQVADGPSRGDLFIKQRCCHEHPLFQRRFVA